MFDYDFGFGGESVWFISFAKRNDSEWGYWISETIGM